MTNKKILSEGWHVGSQTPIDDRLVFADLAALQNMGTADVNAYRYYEGMTVFVVAEATSYRWLESHSGALTTSITYPANIIVNGIDYSNRDFNFVPVSGGTVSFDTDVPTHSYTTFYPDSPHLINTLYISSLNSSIWTWDGSAYKPVPTAWYALGTTTDAGSSKTNNISRTGSITVGADSYFNEVLVGKGSGSIAGNTVVGDKALFSNTTGSKIVAVGYGSLQSNSTGDYNTSVGWGSLSTNTIGSNNTSFGYNSLRYNVAGTSNSSFGTRSLEANTAASNTAMGYVSLLSNTSGNNNTSVGHSSLIGNITGSKNSGFGTLAGAYLLDGSTINTTPENSVFLGYDTRSLGINDTNQIVIGYQALGKGSNTVQIGNASITNTYLQGAVTFNNAFTFPTTDGTANYFLKTNGSGALSWGVAGLSFFSEAQATTGVNATVYANSLTATSTTANADYVMVAKGSGAILARVPDGTGTGGNKRGQYALDLQRYAGASGAYIAAGAYDIILGGSRNSSNTGTYSFIANGDYNSCTGTYGTILNGNNNTVSGARGIVLNGQYNQATGSHAISGGLYSYAQNTAAVALGSSTASGSYSMSINSATTASGTNAFAANNGSTANGISSNAFGDNGWTNGIRAKFAIGASGWGQGNTQAAITQLDARTTNATPTVLQANTQNSPGIDATVQFTLPNNSAMLVKGRIIAKQSGSTNAAAWDFDALLVRGASAATFTVTYSLVTPLSNLPVWGTPTITANTTLGCMTVTVTGVAATNIQWGCRIDSQEIIYA